MILGQEHGLFTLAENPFAKRHFYETRARRRNTIDRYLRAIANSDSIVNSCICGEGEQWDCSCYDESTDARIASNMRPGECFWTDSLEFKESLEAK